MSKFIKLIWFILGLVLYWVSRLIPSDRNLWLFGAWHGNKYGDSSKYLFEYVSENHPDIRAVWITKNKLALELIKSKGYEVYSLYSFKGFWFVARGYVNIFNVSFNDISTFAPAKYLVNLWHGIPLKKIGYDNQVSSVLKKEKVRNLKKVFPFIRGEEFVNLAIASSKVEADILSSAFALPKNKIEVTGLPRNDVFLEKKVQTKISKVIYMPTWRESGSVSIGVLLMENIKKINEFLESSNIELFVKLHPNNEQDVFFDDFTNVKLVLDSDIEQDIYTVINDYDILITDYSSIFFDFLLTDRPIIFFQFDHGAYINKNRELYFDYDSINPGPRCKSWDEVLRWIQIFNESPSEYKGDRFRVKNEFHLYQDGRSCERVFQKISNLVNN